MRVVVALGGNALLARGEQPDASAQEHRVQTAAAALTRLARDHELVVTHGNGPQVGLLALESAADPLLAHPYPFDVLTAQTEGMIGYWLAQALDNASIDAAVGSFPGRSAVALITRTIVDPDDPAFGRPTKFVGPVYSREQASDLGRRSGWNFSRDGDGWRRVVPSPQPVSIWELADIRQLLGAGRTVICAGGGGVSVAYADEGSGVHRLRGVEAVVDKDLTASLLARELSADALLLLTDIDGVYRDFGTAGQQLIRHASAQELRSRTFPAGSMGPKIDGVCSFVEARPGTFAGIGRLDEAEDLLARRSGTIVSPG